MFFAFQVSFNPRGILGGGLCVVTSMSQMRKAEIQESEKGTQALTCDQWRDWGLNSSPRPHPTPLQLCDHMGHME